MSSGTTAWTRCHLGHLGGDDAWFCWLSCGEEGGVGEKCSTVPRTEAEGKLDEEMLGVHQLKGGGVVSGTYRHEGGRDRPVVGHGHGGTWSGGTWRGKK
jgi:hypothetical protein